MGATAPAVLQLDFETRSRVDIKNVGAYEYARHPSTDIWCMAFAFDDEEDVHLWVPCCHGPAMVIVDESPNPWQRVYDHVKGGGEIRAWNAQFERLIWTYILGPRYGFPIPELEQFHCTAAEAAAMSLPRKLGDAARVLGVAQQKDDGGHRLMMQMAKPRKPTKSNPSEWWDDEERRTKLYEYCKQDVRAERDVAKRLRRLSTHERSIYLLDQKINDRGVGVDRELVRSAQKLVGVGMERANEQLERITGGDVTAVTQVGELTKWLQHRHAVPNLRKDVLRDMLLEDDLPADVRQAIEIRAEAAKSSTAKLDKMLLYSQSTGRAHGMLLYHGAGTGRWAGMGPQPQNLTRPTVSPIEWFIPFVLAAGEQTELAYDVIENEEPPLAVVSSMLRSCFRARPGHRLIAGDFSQIEARVLAWIAEQEDLVEAFAKGGKIYERMAAHIYKKNVSEIAKDSYERQIGKTTILGAGFQMGWKTFQAQTKVQTGISLSDKEASDAITAYREMNHRIKQFWYDIEETAIRAVREPGTVQSVGREGKIRYLHKGDWLWCVLPSGRPLAYAKPLLKERTVHFERPNGEIDSFTKVGLQFKGVSSKTRQWGVQHAFGGFLTENVVQAMARDLIASAMLRAEKRGYENVLTVHDEAVAEVPHGFGSLDEFLALMRVRPNWAKGLPVAAEGWSGPRYRK